MAAPEPTIAAMAARAVVMKAAMHGVPPETIYANVPGLDPAVLSDIEGRLPAKVMVALWDEVAPLDADFGLHLAELALAQPALPWHMVRASKTVGDGVVRLIAAWRVFNDLHPPDFTMPANGEDGVLRMRTKNTGYPMPRHAGEFAFAWFALAARRATGRDDVHPKLVMFEHPKPENVTEHARIFGCEVRFDQDATAIYFGAEEMSLATKENDPELVELLSRHAEALIAKLPPRGDFIAEIRQAMTPLLASGDVSIERVAKVLGTSPRSIQRKLSSEQASFQRVFDDLRTDTAKTFLGDRSRSLAEIALLLGFSDQTTFHRAFVRWTGMTPGEARRRAVR